MRTAAKHILSLCAICGVPFETSGTYREICPLCGDDSRTPMSLRACHDCGVPTPDYRCRACRAAWRARHDICADEE